MIPIGGTRNSGINFLTWTQRFANKVSKDRRVEGCDVLRSDGTRARTSDYRRNTSSKHEDIQATTNLIDPDCDIWEEYGVHRLRQRLFTTQTIKMGVKPLLIELQPRWSTDRARGERSVQRTMIHNYAELRNMKDTLKQPLQAC